MPQTTASQYDWWALQKVCTPSFEATCINKEELLHAAPNGQVTFLHFIFKIISLMKLQDHSSVGIPPAARSDKLVTQARS